MKPSTISSIQTTFLFLHLFLSCGGRPSLSLDELKRSKRQNFNDVTQVFRSDSDLFISEDVDEASTGKAVPNSWLYRFPPWYLPHNPPPDGFASRDVNSILNKVEDDQDALSLDLQQVKDGDVIIVSDLVKSDRQGRLHNVKIPGGTLYRDEVVQTIVDFSLSDSLKDTKIPDEGVLLKRGKSPGAVVQNGITIQDEKPAVFTQAPILVAPIPPKVFPERTVITTSIRNNNNLFIDEKRPSIFTQNPPPVSQPPPKIFPPRTVVTTRVPTKSRNNNGFLITDGVNGKKFPGNIRISSNLANNVVQESGFTSQKVDTGEFRPSPPDLSLNRVQPQHNRNSVSTFPFPVFRPSPSGTPNRARGLPVHEPASLQRPSGFSKSQLPSNPVHHKHNGGFTKQNNRQPSSTLSAVISRNNSERKPLWFPVVPIVSSSVNQNVNRPTFSSHSFGQTPQNFQVNSLGENLRVTYQPSNVNSGFIKASNDRNNSPNQPASIQDIINNGYDTAQILLRSEKDNGNIRSFPPSSTSSRNTAKQNNSWFWQKTS